MATPASSEWVELTADGQTLLIGSKAIWCRDLTGLHLVGPSRGQNLEVARMQGTHPLGRERDELGLEMRGMVCDGEWDEDNNPVTSGTRANMKTLLRKVFGFLDAAPGRLVTITYHDDGETYVGDAHFEEPSDVEMYHDLAEFALLFTVHGGLLESTT
jgi:hypothetical protein